MSFRLASVCAALCPLLFSAGCKMPVATYAMLEADHPPFPKDYPLGATVFVEFIQVETDRFERWIQNHSTSPELANRLRKEVQTWIDRGQGRSLDIVSVYCRSGSRAAVRSIKEIRFPVEYSHPSRNVGQGDESDEGLTPLEDKTGKATTVGLNPVRFKKQDVGTILEVEAFIDKNTGLIDLTVAPELVGEAPHREWNITESESHQLFLTPVFEANSLRSSITLRSGIYGFLGSGKLSSHRSASETQTSMVLVFIRADSNSQPLVKTLEDTN